MVARRYGISVRVALKNILPRESEIHIFELPYIFACEVKLNVSVVYTCEDIFMAIS